MEICEPDLGMGPRHEAVWPRVRLRIRRSAFPPGGPEDDSGSVAPPRRHLGGSGSGRCALLFGALGTFEAGTTVADVVGAILVTAILGGTFAPASIARRAELQAVEGRELLSAESPSGPE